MIYSIAEKLSIFYQKFQPFACQSFVLQLVINFSNTYLYINRFSECLPHVTKNKVKPSELLHNTKNLIEQVEPSVTLNFRKLALLKNCFLLVLFLLILKF